MLKETFITLCKGYSCNDRDIESLWSDIVAHYTNKRRYYHTLLHLESMLKQLTAIKDQLHHWEAILFALVYHDIIYNPIKSNNEEKSAAYAVKVMQQLSVSQPVIDQCKQLILATKSHAFSPDNDINSFTDADLSVLGADWETYNLYTRGIRKEYIIFPDFMYKPGRKKVINHFLSMKRIFKTDHFFDKLESKARNNLQREMTGL